MFAYTERGIKKMYIRLKENVHTFCLKRMDVYFEWLELFQNFDSFFDGRMSSKQPA